MHRPRESRAGRYRTWLRLLVAGLIATSLTAISTPPATASDPPPDVLVASVVNKPMDVNLLSYPSFDSNGIEGETQWRVVGGLNDLTSPGNYAEQYLSTTPSGRLLDFSTYPQYSDDRGETWFEAHTQEPLLSNEGAIAAAPNGDVIAIDWYFETADRIVSFKYDHASGTWTYSYGSLHTPYFDRPWLTAVPGPFTIDGESAPYVGLLHGGFPKGDPPYFVATDGLHYLHASYKTLDGETAHSGDPLPTGQSPDMDFIQPQAQGDMYPLVHGSIADNATGEWYVTGTPDMKWSAYSPFSTQPVGTVLEDSLGRIHYISFGTTDQSNKFDYWMSSDGGATWDKQTVRLPNRSYVSTYLDWDAKTNAQAGVTAVAVHATDPQSGNTQDLVYKFSTTSDHPMLERMYRIGTGDLPATGGLTSEAGPARFDFSSVAIFPDGRVATSFEDSTHTINALAVELDTSAPTQPPVTPLPSSEITSPADGTTRRASAVKRIKGTASDGSGSADAVDVALARTIGARCKWLGPHGWRGDSCDSPRWTRVDTVIPWSLDLQRALPQGDYVAFSRASGVGPLGQDYVESCCIDGINRISFHITH